MKVAILILLINIGFLYADSGDGLAHQWLFDNNFEDSEGNADLYDGVNYEFVNDRFNNSKSAIKFNSGYVKIPAGSYFSSDFTITLWVNLQVIRNWQRIIEFGNGKPLDNVVLLWHDYTSRIFHSIANGVKNINYSITDENIPLYKWQHIAYVVSGRVGVLFLNGKAVSSVTFSEDVKVVDRKSNFIGKGNWDDTATNAIFDDIRIYDIALCASEILEMASDY